MNAPLLRLALGSLANRRVTAGLTVLAIALSVALLLGVEKVRTGARASFANTISGTDLIVGARSGSIQLLLYSVFRIGDATSNISWESYRDMRAWPEIAWSVPISLGDSHRGFRVVGTTGDYFERYNYGRRQALAFAAGRPFEDLFEAAVGADVAEELGYAVGDRIVLAHGAGAFGFTEHDDKPFVISGVLARTGTPVDRSVHVSLEAIEAIHIDWRSGRPPRPGQGVSAEETRRLDLEPKAVTAVLLGLKSRMAAFAVQRRVNAYKEEALLAISVMVVVTGFMGMIAVSLSALGERRREMAILRSVGARPIHIFLLLVLESGLLAAIGALIGTVLLYGGLAIAQGIAQSRFGFYLPVTWPTSWELALLGLVVVAGCLAGVIPALLAYRRSLADGMTIRI